MKNTFGNSLAVTIFGESHGEAIGCVMDGLASGITIDFDNINRLLAKRRPSGAISTARKEADDYKIISGAFNGYTTGTPLTILIPNSDTHSQDYQKMQNIMRPSHADYPASVRYNGFQDYRGGGHFSGRITAALVAAGAICETALERKGIVLASHLAKCGGISDDAFSDIEANAKALKEANFPTLSSEKGEMMQAEILKARDQGDSVGGVVEVAVQGVPAGVGEPWFDTIEGTLSHALFSVPGVKGVEFGAGFSVCDMLGSEANDQMKFDGGKVVTFTNNNGGIAGGITNGMPILFRCAVKPTPSIAKEQKTVDLASGENTVLEIKGRHDPCIAHRALVVIEAVTAILLYDALASKFGTDFFSEAK